MVKCNCDECKARQKASIETNRKNALNRYHKVKDSPEYKLQQRLKKQNQKATKIKALYNVSDDWIAKARQDGKYGLSRAILKLKKERSKLIVEPLVN